MDEKGELVQAGARVHQQTVEFTLYQHPKTGVFYWMIGQEYWAATHGSPPDVRKRLIFEK